MWSIITSAVGSIFGSWVDLKKAKYEAETSRHLAVAKIEGDWDMEALRQSQYSWKDEFITIIWFAPLVVAWFDQDRALGWVDFVTKLPVWYQFGMFGIMAASFGLRWFFKQQGFKIANQAVKGQKNG
jgi:hypothetical protein